MKKKRIIYWLNQIRRPICFIIVLSIVAIYFMSSVANADGVISTGDFVNRFQLNTSNTYPRALERDTMKAYYQQDGHDPANITYNMQYFGIGTYDPFNINTLVSNNLITVNSYDTGSIIYDLSNTHVLMGGVNNTSSIMCYYFYGNGNFAVVNNVVVSDQPFKYFGFYINDYQTIDSFVRIGDGTQAQNDLYEYPFYTWYSLNCNFTDLDVYFPSSDSGSGFASYSSSSTDFDFSDVGSYYNFNYLKTKDYIVSPADPEPLPETLSQFYTYCGVDAYFTDGNASRVLLHYTISPNEYMRLHPEMYDVMIDISAVIVTNSSDHPNIPLTYSKSYLQGLETYINLGSTPNLQVDFDDLLSAQSNNSLADALEGWWGAVTNTNTVYYNPNGSVISYGGSNPSGGTRSFGGYSLNPNLKISDIVFQCAIRVESNNTDPRQVSGSYRFQQGLISNNRTVLENTIANNFNPPESYSGQYPAEIKDSQGNVVVGGTSVNPVIYNNLNAAIEYLFNLDTSDMTNITGNIANNFQYVINQVSDTSDNGFWGVLKETYDLIPEPIWTWLKVAVGVILGSCVYQWVLGGVRIKRG